MMLSPVQDAAALRTILRRRGCGGRLYLGIGVGIGAADTFVLSNRMPPSALIGPVTQGTRSCRSGDTRRVLGVRFHSPATCVSRAAKRLFSRNGRSAPRWCPAADPWRGCRVSSGVGGRSKWMGGLHCLGATSGGAKTGQTADGAGAAEKPGCRETVGGLHRDTRGGEMSAPAL